MPLRRWVLVIGGVLVVLCVVALLVVRYAVLPKSSVDLSDFAGRVGTIGAGSDRPTDRTLVGALAYSLAQVTDGSADDFWASTEGGTDFVSLSLHLPGEQSRTVTVIATPGGSTPGRCGNHGRCAVAHDPDGGAVMVQCPGRLLTPSQLRRIANEPWWNGLMPATFTGASRWLKVQHVQDSIAD